MTQTQTTEFARADRAPQAVLQNQSALLETLPLLQTVYDAVNEAVMILNPQRQIVFCNRHTVEMLGLDGPDAVVGLRPGEAVGCIHACQSDSGCGTTAFCSTCGAVSAILSGLDGHPDTRECHILRDDHGGALDLLVRTTPLQLAEETFVIVALTDVGHQNRRRALERVFFHDVMNTISGLRMLSQGMSGTDLNRIQHTAKTIVGGLTQLVDEITTQRDLLAAESDDLAVRPTTVGSMHVLESVAETYGPTVTTNGRMLKIDPDAENIRFSTDVGIVTRVLGNMIKNAVEASETGGTVTIGCKRGDREVQFWVHNAGAMPRKVQLQVFKRSFSTKGAGRGLGTYSMKLLTEKYLKGRVEFTTSKKDGTVFTASYPLKLAST